MKRKVLLKLLFFLLLYLLCGCESDIEFKKESIEKEFDDYVNNLSNTELLEKEWNAINKIYMETKEKICYSPEMSALEVQNNIQNAINRINIIYNNRFELIKLDGEERFTTGDGSKDNPFMIDSESKMRYFINQVNMDGSENKYYKLGSNIEMNQIVSKCNYFCNKFYGNLDGNGYVLNNYSGKGKNHGSAISLFQYNYGCINKLGITNLHLRDSNREKAILSGIVNYNYGEIKNCYVIGEITVSDDGIFKNDNTKSIAGICYLNSGIIENCFTRLSIVVEGRDEKISFVKEISGICCYNAQITGIRNCLVYKFWTHFRKNTGSSDYVTIECEFESISNKYTNCYYYSSRFKEDRYSNVNLEDVYEIDFYLKCLCWDESIWDLRCLEKEEREDLFKEGIYPKIKMEEN